MSNEVEEIQAPETGATDESMWTVADLVNAATTPGVIAALAVAGVVGGRYARGVYVLPPVAQLAAVAATSAGSAALAHFMLPHLMCPRSDSAPVAEGALSTVYAWGAVYATMGSESAWMFAPLQFVAHVGGTVAAKKLSERN